MSSSPSPTSASRSTTASAAPRGAVRGRPRGVGATRVQRRPASGRSVYGRLVWTRLGRTLFDRKVCRCAAPLFGRRARPLVAPIGHRCVRASRGCPFWSFVAPVGLCARQASGSVSAQPVIRTAARSADGPTPRPVVARGRSDCGRVETSVDRMSAGSGLRIARPRSVWVGLTPTGPVWSERR